MPSKLTFALVALLAATSSVSAMPMPMPGNPAQAPPPVDASALAQANAPLQPTTGGLQQPPVVQTPQQPLQGPAQPHSHSHSHVHHHPHEHAHALNAATGPVHPHAHHNPHHPHHHHALNQPVAPLTAAPVVGGPVAGAPLPPVSAGPVAPALQRREFYESYVEDLIARDPFATGGEHHHHHHPHEGHFGHHPHHQHHHHHDASADSTAPGVDPVAPPADGTVSPQRREVLERRGFLEAIGLKAYQKDLTKKQNELLKKAEDECNALPHSSKKDKNKCLDAVKHITKLTKERNHYVEEFIKKTGKHDLFPYADPDYKGEFFSHHSSTSSSSAFVQPPPPYGYPPHA